MAKTLNNENLDNGLSRLWELRHGDLNMEGFDNWSINNGDLNNKNNENRNLKFNKILTTDYHDMRTSKVSEKLFQR